MTEFDIKNFQIEIEAILRENLSRVDTSQIFISRTDTIHIKRSKLQGSDILMQGNRETIIKKSNKPIKEPQEDGEDNTSRRAGGDVATKGPSRTSKASKRNKNRVMTR